MAVVKHTITVDWARGEAVCNCGMWRVRAERHDLIGACNQHFDGMKRVINGPI